MSNLESIVPPLELCKKIPEGEFEDSALVWCRVRGEDVVCAREHWVGVFGMSPVPAPTLEEILEAIREIQAWDTLTITRATDDKTKLATAALRLWFKVKGIEVE